MANTLAYYDAATIMAVKSFIVQAHHDTDQEKEVECFILNVPGVDVRQCDQKI